MSKARIRAATVGGTPHDVEGAFYEALQNARITQLIACRADEDDIVYVLPGGSRLVARHASPGTLQDAEKARAVPEMLQ